MVIVVIAISQSEILLDSARDPVYLLIEWKVFLGFKSSDMTVEPTLNINQHHYSNYGVRYHYVCQS